MLSMVWVTITQKLENVTVYQIADPFSLENTYFSAIVSAARTIPQLHYEHLKERLLTPEFILSQKKIDEIKHDESAIRNILKLTSTKPDMYFINDVIKGVLSKYRELTQDGDNFCLWVKNYSDILRSEKIIPYLSWVKDLRERHANTDNPDIRFLLELV